MSAPLTHISVHVSLIIWEALPPHNISALHLSLLPLLHFLSCLTSSSSAALGTLLLFLQVPPTASSIRPIRLFFFFFLNDQPGLFLSFFFLWGFLEQMNSSQLSSVPSSLSFCTLWSLLFFRTPTALICNSANLMGSSLHSRVFFFFFPFSPFSFCASALCAALASCVPLLFSSPSLAASQFRNYSSGLKQWW